MKIIITKTFFKDYGKILNKNKLEKVVEKIKQKLEKDLIYLKRPFLKIKFNIDKISVRLIGKYVDNRFLLFPIFIYKKSNKKDGYNVIWKTFEEKVLKRMDKINLDLKNGDFEVY